MPIWKGDKTGKIRVIGSIAELQKWAVGTGSSSPVELTDIHREYVDDLKVWVDDEKTEEGTRIKDVFDCWIESGSMPYASVHYPFEHKEVFESRYPAQYIVEYIAQTRAWFYTLHVMSVALFGKPAFENAVTTGTILAEDGTKMSKSKKNYPDVNVLIGKFGVDSLRLYLMSSVVMKADNLNFSESAVAFLFRCSMKQMTR
jgi:isoleucyl-tRNA synthetase